MSQFFGNGTPSQFTQPPRYQGGAHVWWISNVEPLAQQGYSSMEPSGEGQVGVNVENHVQMVILGGMVG